jgi:hypothetical protein
MSHLTSEQRYTISVLLERAEVKSRNNVVIKKKTVRLTRELQRSDFAISV